MAISDKSRITSLVKSIEKKFGKRIQTQQDVMLLREYISSETGFVLGFNTLRRFLGFLKGTKPNSKTLNVLAQYLGYLNHTEFEKAKSNDLEWHAWKSVFNICSNSHFSQKEIDALLKLKSTDPCYYLYLIHIINHSIQHAQLFNLGAIYSEPQLFDLEYQIRLRVALGVGGELRKLSLHEYENLRFLCEYISFRETLIYLFVDYSHLEGYYLYMLSACADHEFENDNIVFISLMSSYSDYLLCNVHIRELPLVEPSDKYSTLKGRYFGWCLLQSDTHEVDNVFNKLMISARKLNDFMGLFLEIVPALIFIKRLDLIKIIVDDHYEKVFNAFEWQHSTEESMYLIGEALVYIKAGRVRSAKSSVSLIYFNIADSYSDYLKLFLLIVEYQINLVDAPSELMDIEMKYLEIVECTGLKKFSLEMLKNY